MTGQESKVLLKIHKDVIADDAKAFFFIVQAIRLRRLCYKFTK